MSSSLRLGVLDFGRYFAPQSAGDVIAAARRDAQLADRLGYSRYWLAEHHEPGIAWATPEILVPLLADSTRRIRIGTAGILLHFYSSYRVAEVFSLLERMYPGRIDCGVAAGVSAEPVRSALRPGFDLAETIRSQEFGRKVAEVLGYLRDGSGMTAAAGAGARLADARISSFWLMGLGEGSRILASRHGAGFSYSIFHGGTRQDPAAIRAYRDEFRPSPELARPACNLACSIICAETEAVAHAQRKRHEEYTGGSMFLNVCGTPEQCREQLLELAGRYDVDEIILLSNWHVPRRREEGYRLLAQAMGLTPEPEAGNASAETAAARRTVLWPLSYHYNPPRS